MVWIPKIGQTIRPKDDIQTSSIAPTCHTSVARKGVGKNKKMIWVPKGYTYVEAKVDVQTSMIRSTHEAKKVDYKDKKDLSIWYLLDTRINTMTRWSIVYISDPKSLMITS
jgi:hypothetical protein